jgi:hypothetical protein
LITWISSDDQELIAPAKEALIEVGKGNLKVALAIVRSIANPKLEKKDLFSVLEEIQVCDEKVFSGLLSFVNKPGKDYKTPQFFFLQLLIFVVGQINERMEVLKLISKLKITKTQNEGLYVKIVGGLIEACFDDSTQADAKDALVSVIGDDKEVKKQVEF